MAPTVTRWRIGGTFVHDRATITPYDTTYDEPDVCHCIQTQGFVHSFRSFSHAPRTFVRPQSWMMMQGHPPQIHMALECFTCAPRVSHKNHAMSRHMQRSWHGKDLFDGMASIVWRFGGYRQFTMFRPVLAVIDRQRLLQ